MRFVVLISVAPAERENGHQRGWLHHQYGQPGWWASVDDPEDSDGQLIDEDNLVRAAARRA
jgi:hypothetical protein